MSEFERIDDQYDPHAVEERTVEYWEEVDAYERTKDHRAGADEFFFLDGPPYTSGAAHMGTTWNKTLKDAYIRYLRMAGHDVTDRPGYDMHGLPIETKVEEELGFENKKDIEEFGMENFIEECMSFAEGHLDAMTDDFRSFGVWMDWENPYRTISPEYMEAAWWGFSNAHERGLVEKGQRSISQCPRCETAIANNEVEYEDVEDPSIYVTMPLADREGSLVIWTTTPWTIPGNTFVAVAEDLTYQGVRAEKDGNEEVLWIAAECVEEVLSKGRYEDYEVVDEVTGEEMVGWEYDHPFGDDGVDHPGGDGAFQVYTADYVEADRTGLVHSAPGHGEEDFLRGSELGLPTFCPVGGDGVFDKRAGPYAGQFVRDANADIRADLDDRGLLLADETYEHSYGHCWRCDTGIVQIVTDQWFITVSDIKDELLANIEDSEWYPQEARDVRFRDFVEESPDWNVSRQRYWGIPIPIWTPEEWSGKMDDAIVIGTREELVERVDQEIDPKSVDLHRPTVDDLTITEDGVTYTRVPDVFDVWLDSSVASWGTLDYPERADEFERLWPADLIIEAHDQTRGWFWSQLGMGTAAVGEVPYDEVLMHGHALAEDGRKMSKSIGNTIEPDEVIDEHGADPMRAFLLSVTPQEDDMRFSWDEVATMQRNLNILSNVFRFPLPYMALDGVEPGRSLSVRFEDGTTEALTLDDVADDLETIDRWLLSRLATVTAEATESWEAYRQDRALNAVVEFVVEDLSRLYVQAVRERMWEEADSPQKRAAYVTLHRALLDVVTMLAPAVPFVTDELYGTLTGDEGHPTVHMCDWPEPEERWRDPELEADVELLRAAEEAGSDARQRAEHGLRWPVRRVVVAADDPDLADAVERHGNLLAERLNAREIDVVAPDEDWDELRYSAEADMSELGPAFGGRAQDVMRALNEARIEEPSLDALEDAVSETLDESVDLDERMVEFVTETPDGVTGSTVTRAGDEFGSVYVDATLTQDVESEGYARELIRRVQEMRKELDLDVDERIRLEYAVDDDRVAGLLAEHESLVIEEVRAEEVGTVEDGLRREWDVADVTVTIAVERVAEATA